MTELEMATINKMIRTAVREELIGILQPSLMKLPEAATRIGKSAAWLRKLCKAGLDGAVRTGGVKNQHFLIDLPRAIKDLEKQSYKIR
jgi:hypothetical protein